MFFTKFMSSFPQHISREKNVHPLPTPPPTYTFFHLDFFRGTGRGRGDKYFMNKKPKNRFNNFETFNPLKKTF